jgi:hypothetical protein
MKLSENTLAILSNFSKLHDSMLFYPGKEIKNLSEDGAIYMTATIEEEFPEKFAIYSIRELLQVLSLVEDADLEFRDRHIFISNSENSVIFRFSAASVVDDIYKRKLTLSDPAFEVKLSLQDIKKMFKAAGYLKIHDVRVEPGEKGKLTLHDKKGSHQHLFSFYTDVAIETAISFNIKGLEMLEIGYKLAYYPERNMVRFEGVEIPVTYTVTC